MQNKMTTLCKMVRLAVALGLGVSVSSAFAIAPWRHGERQPIWPDEKTMPYFNERQIAEMTDVSKASGFVRAEHRIPYLEWFEPPAETNRNGACMILVPGGSYEECCDVSLVKEWKERFTALGYQTVSLIYRTPRSGGKLPFYQTAWADGQRGVRLVRAAAAKRGFDSEKVGLIGMSAGGHLTVLLAGQSQTRAYEPIDEIDKLPCHLNIAVANAAAYATKGGWYGIDAAADGTFVAEPEISPVLRFDAKTCPVSFHHGAADFYSPNGSSLCYRELRKLKIPTELHLYADHGHGAWGLERAVEFLHQMNFDGRLGAETERRVYTGRYTARTEKEYIWPLAKGQTEYPTNAPFMTWYVPKRQTTKAIQVVFPGGGYNFCNAKGEGLPVAEYLNAKGMTVVVVEYTTPRPTGRYVTPPKHQNAWRDAQRAIRVIRHGAPARGLDPDRIGAMGFSAGGHLTLMAALSSTFPAYWPLRDEIDRTVSCKVQWACPIYPAYVLTDGADGHNADGGNLPEDKIVNEFLFDVNTPPMCFVHGDADGYASMGSVKVWERLRHMGAQSDIHTLATRGHCFQFKAADGTGSATWLDRVWDFISRKGFIRD